MLRSTPFAPSRRSLLLGAAAAGPLVALGAGRASAALGEFHDAAGLRMIDGSPWRHPDLRSVDFRFDTGGMVKTFPPSVRVTVPPSYLEDPDRRFPVLLLLHGRGGNSLEWTEGGGTVLEETEQHDVIVVMPDGGAGSFYSNANAPLPGREANWESFIMDQVLPFVHANFRTAPQRMAIGGLSMGGWGALSLGQRYWGHFRSVSSYSGPADCSERDWHSWAVAGAIWICPAFDAEKYVATANPSGATWGPELFPRIASGYNPIENLERYRDKRVFLRTGDGPWNDFFDGLHGDQDLLIAFQDKLGEMFGDGVENVVHPNLQSFSDALDDAAIDHDFELIAGATHDWELWADNLAEDLPGMMAVLEA
ncbi:alpha/beta hydrolase [Brachybacterium sacelli]|uniref:Acyl-CoA:diacylglycerol acyltransferase n=1 Tax=Brachybacterium sacelli TaxID=173364 RepID=A0ABS4WV68_9MICO|nr:alpha/beta hydrolase-fold protein [Brachybacterium sacelli]MBP2380098.1 S-formylglutathione hydrolase FrmB [Brachybacterium sacelli]